MLLHERCFLGVEGDTEMRYVPVLFQLVTGKPLQSAGIDLINGQNDEGARDSEPRALLNEPMRHRDADVADNLDPDTHRLVQRLLSHRKASRPERSAVNE